MNILSTEFQTELTKAILQDHSFLLTNRKFIGEGLFKDTFEHELIKKILVFFDKYNCSPSETSLFEMFIKDGYAAEDVKDSIHEYYLNPVKDISFITDSICDFVKRTRLRDIILNSVKLLDKGKYDKIYEDIKEAVFINTTGDDIGSLFWEDKKKVLENLDIIEPFIPTGFTELDTIMFGGCVRGTLNVVITPPNRGKTTTLVNLGKNAVLNGYKVIHYTFELSDRMINRRYFMSITGMSKQELKLKKKTAFDKILKVADKVMSDSLIVKKFPANICTPNDIRRHLSAIKNKFGFIPDLIIFDYADLMQSANKYDERRFEIESIYYDLRNIAEEFNSVNWTASQTGRNWKEKEVITIEDVDECYKKAAASDVIVSLNQTLEEKRSHPQTARLFVAKNRDDESQVEITLKTDWGKAWVGDL